MDEQRFDTLSRRLAGVRTRRQAIKAIAGAVVASVAGVRAAEAQQCTAHYNPCSGDGQCCAGAVCEYGLCMPGCRIDGGFTSAWMSPPDTICAQCRPELSTTSWSPANEGMSCWSGDPNAGVTTCQSGLCRSTGPIDCRPLTACHTASINAQTGQCVQAFSAAGTPCGGPATCAGEFFTPADTCDGNGFCIGGGSQTRSCAPYKCGQGACTTACVSDADCAGGAHCDDGQCISDLDLGQLCDEDSDCQSGMCVEGVCCNQRCEGLCETCSAETSGRCSPVICDDGLSCTSGACDEATGACSHTRNPGTCLIDNVCYSSGAINPANACEVCDAAADPDGWSAAVCPDDALSCTTATCDPVAGCGQAINADSCLIDGDCYASGAVNPADSCTVCDPASDQEDWSPCMHGGVCYNGACVSAISGELTPSSPHGAVHCGNVENRPYDTYTFTHAGGLFKLDLRGEDGGGGTLWDPLAALYTSFNPADPCANLIELDDHDGCVMDAYIEIADLATGTYTILATSVPWRRDPSLIYGTYTAWFGQGPACPD